MKEVTDHSATETATHDPIHDHAVAANGATGATNEDFATLSAAFHRLCRPRVLQQMFTAWHRYTAVRTEALRRSSAWSASIHCMAAHLHRFHLHQWWRQWRAAISDDDTTAAAAVTAHMSSFPVPLKQPSWSLDRAQRMGGNKASRRRSISDSDCLHVRPSTLRQDLDAVWGVHSATPASARKWHVSQDWPCGRPGPPPPNGHARRARAQSTGGGHCCGVWRQNGRGHSPDIEATQVPGGRTPSFLTISSPLVPRGPNSSHTLLLTGNRTGSTECSDRPLPTEGTPAAGTAGTDIELGTREAAMRMYFQRQRDTNGVRMGKTTDHHWATSAALLKTSACEREGEHQREQSACNMAPPTVTASHRLALVSTERRAALSSSRLNVSVLRQRLDSGADVVAGALAGADAAASTASSCSPRSDVFDSRGGAKVPLLDTVSTWRRDAKRSLELHLSSVLSRYLDAVSGPLPPGANNGVSAHGAAELESVGIDGIEDGLAQVVLGFAHKLAAQQAHCETLAMSFEEERTRLLNTAEVREWCLLYMCPTLTSSLPRCVHLCQS